MSWDATSRDYRIYGNITEEKKNELLDYLEELNETLGEALNIDTKYIPEGVIVEIIEEGLYKYGCFRGVINDEKKFIENIINIDKENIEVEMTTNGWCETDSEIYYYKDGEIRRTTRQTREFEEVKNNKEELIKKIKKDISYFESLSKEERKNIEYQKASMYAEYPSITWEFGTDDYDKMYSDEFVKSEDALRLAFKLGTRNELLKKRILPNFINNTALLKELLPLKPRYIRYMPNELKRDKELILKLIEKDKETRGTKMDAEDIDSSLYSDKDVMLKFLDISPYSLEYASEELKIDYDYCSKAAEKDLVNLFVNIKNEKVLNENIVRVISSVGVLFNDTKLPNIKITDELRNNLNLHKELFKNFITRDDWSLSKEEKLNKKKQEIDGINSIEELFLFCYRKKEFSIPDLYYAMLPNSLIRDENFIKNVQELNKTRRPKMRYGGEFRDKLKVILNDELLQDENAIEMFRKNKIEIVFRPEFITTKEAVIAMLKNKSGDKWNKIELRNLNENLRNDLEVQKEYILQNGSYSIKEINPKLLKDKEIREIAFENLSLFLEGILDGDYGYFNDEEFSVAVLKELLYIKELTNFNYEDLLILVRNNPLILLYTKENYFGDKKMMMEAVKGNMSILRFANKELLKDKDILNAAIESEFINHSVLKLFDNSVFTDKNIALKIVKKAPDIYEKLSDELKQDKEIIEYAKAYFYNLRCFPEKYKENAKFVVSMLSKNFSTEWLLQNFYKTEYKDNEENKIPLFSEKLLNNKEFMLKLCSINPGAYESNELHMLSGDDIIKDPEYLKEVINIRAERYKKKKDEYIRLPKDCMKTIGEDEKLSLEEMYFMLLNQDMRRVYFAEYMNNNIEYYKKYLAKQEIINSELDLENCNTFEEIIDEIKGVRYIYAGQAFPANLLKNERVAKYILSKYDNYVIENGEIVRKLKNELKYTPTHIKDTTNDGDNEDNEVYQTYLKYLKQKELILAGETDVDKIVFKQECDDECEDEEYEENISEYFDEDGDWRTIDVDEDDELPF